MFDSRYSPLTSVMPVNCRPVSRSTAVTVTPGSTALDSSVTAPMTSTSCADTVDANRKTARETPAARTRVRIMVGAPWKGRGARRSRLGACYLRHLPANALELRRRRSLRMGLRNVGTRWILIVAATLAAATALYAQRIWVGGPGGGFWSGGPPKFGVRDDFDGSFNYCRGFYNSVTREIGGSGWGTDYPGADNNFSVRLAELSLIRVRLNPDGQPAHVVLRLTDPLLSRCPLLFMEDVGTANFTDEEVLALRNYLLKGGFLWVDDFWGSYAWDRWVAEIGRVLPPHQYPIDDIAISHPIMRTLYDVHRMPQVPSISHWYRSGGQTSERGADSAVVTFKGIQD